ncbi:MAG TPA: formylglycine-generating enzyme family protein [Polyangiaceae bacterium]|jgi:formylglycine-generating enzyme required for sulfatase activity
MRAEGGRMRARDVAAGAHVGLRVTRVVVVVASVAAAAASVAGCSRAQGAGPDEAGAAAFVSAPSTIAPGAPRPGMVWIPTGTLKAGSALDEVPRLADVEPAGVDVPMAGFYMDVLPWPDEAGAIPTTNVSRQEAALLCAGKGKRLCSELEWERACKGPAMTRYEYGATYDPKVCGGGIAAETAARHPSGGKPACASGFGVREMHGGAWEWTDSPWNRGAPGRGDGAPGRGEAAMGVMRGGDAVAGELETRCAFAKEASPASRSPSAGFRCCAGPRNDAEVALDVKTGVAFEKTTHPARSSPALDALGGVTCGPPLEPAPCSLSRAWTWRPAPNVELSLAGGCMGRDPNARCAIAVSRTIGDRVDTLAQVDTGREIPEVVLVEGMDRRIRVRGADLQGPFFREVVFSFGRVEVKPVH